MIHICTLQTRELESASAADANLYRSNETMFITRALTSERIGEFAIRILLSISDRDKNTEGKDFHLCCKLIRHFDLLLLKDQSGKLLMPTLNFKKTQATFFDDFTGDRAISSISWDTDKFADEDLKVLENAIRKGFAASPKIRRDLSEMFSDLDVYLPLLFDSIKLVDSLPKKQKNSTPRIIGLEDRS